jgi:hypothetical protein
MPTFPLPATKSSVTTRHKQSKQVTAFQAYSYGAVTLKGKQREEPVDLSSATELSASKPSSATKGIFANT